MSKIDKIDKIFANEYSFEDFCRKETYENDSSKLKKGLDVMKLLEALSDVDFLTKKARFSSDRKFKNKCFSKIESITLQVQDALQCIIIHHGADVCLKIIDKETGVAKSFNEYKRLNEK